MNTVSKYTWILLGASLLFGAVLWWLLSLDPVISWLIAANLVAFAANSYDKSIAGSGRTRIPERALLIIALAGGSLGAWAGMRIFHHKTAKSSFLARFWLIVALQILVLAGYWFFIKPAIS